MVISRPQLITRIITCHGPSWHTRSNTFRSMAGPSAASLGRGPPATITSSIAKASKSTSDIGRRRGKTVGPNAEIERHHRTLGARIDQHDLKDRTQAKAVIASIIAHYSHARLQSARAKKKGHQVGGPVVPDVVPWFSSGLGDHHHRHHRRRNHRDHRRRRRRNHHDHHRHCAVRGAWLHSR